MGSDSNGITQSPFKDAWTTPDVGGQGLNGTGGGLDTDAGPQGIVNSPFDKAWPTPGTGETPCADLGQPAPKTVSVDGGAPGSNQPWDVTSSRNTVDKK